MTLPVIIALLALSVADPSGDAFGDGTLTPPTAPLYANTAVFDLQSVSLDAPPADAAGTRLTVTLGSLGLSAEAAETAEAPEAAPAAAGQEDGEETPLTTFVPAVVDVYLGGAQGGYDRTLPGPDLFFPRGTSWEYAVRITSDGAYYVAYPQDALDEDSTVSLDVLALPRVPLDVLTVGTSLVVYLPVTLPADTLVHAMTGVYDPFSTKGWRRLSETPSPWQYSGATDQQSPVVDLIARNADAQRAALRSGILPDARAAPTVLNVPWLWVMAAGLLVAGAGLVMRGRVRRFVPEPVEAPVFAETTPDPETPSSLAPEEGSVESVGPGAEAAQSADPDPVLGEDEAPVDILESETKEEPPVAAQPEEVAEVGAALAPHEPDDAGVPAADREPDDAPQPEEPEEAEVSAADQEPDDVQSLVQAVAPESAQGDRKADPFGTGAEGSFLVSLDDPRSIEDFLSDDGDEESFWHPRARKSPMVEQNADEAALDQAELAPPVSQNEDADAG